MIQARPPQQSEVQSLIDERGTARLALSKDGIFHTIQGEGPRLGRNTTFIRLAGCNLSCSWCDTSYTWDWTGKNGHVYSVRDEVRLATVEEVAGQLFDASSITVTGGEPLLQAAVLDQVFGKLGYISEINFETNGTIAPPSFNGATGIPINYVVSPKLSNSGEQFYDAQNIKEFRHYKGGAADFKFVCKSIADLSEVEQFVRSFLIPGNRVWIMPEGVEPGLVNNRARELAPEVIKRGYNLTTRFHLQLWGNMRGR